MTELVLNTTNDGLAPRTDGFTAASADHAKKYLASLTPKDTDDAYKRDWAVWLEFIREWSSTTGVRHDGSEVTADMLTHFVRWLDENKHAAISTMKRRLAGVLVTARQAGVRIDKEDTKGARQAIGRFEADTKRMRRGRGKAAAATPGDVTAMAATATEGGGPAGARDAALAVVAFQGAMRSAEVALIDIGDVWEGDGGLYIQVTGLKGHAAREVFIAPSRNKAACAVALWKAWIEVRGYEPGAAFGQVDRWGNCRTEHLAPESVQRILKSLSLDAGVGPRTGHSMRRGFITSARKAGKRVEKIRKQSGHSEKSSSFWGYIDDADLVEDNASDGLL
ncbi:tyrosine-type recombinase/integrase [Streptomyces sp. NPDC000927]|uniref:tyrosine-type recombinase/integrase n=1 Tax=Streptomyces sp. NPDC000927 TaxID=3154371 RepID=UPI003326A985